MYPGRTTCTVSLVFVLMHCVLLMWIRSILRKRKVKVNACKDITIDRIGVSESKNVSNVTKYFQIWIVVSRF